MSFSGLPNSWRSSASRQNYWCHCKMWDMSDICLWFVICSGDKCRMDVVFDRQAAIKLSGMSEKAYNRSFTSMQNGIGVKSVLELLFHCTFSFLWICTCLLEANRALLDVRFLLMWKVFLKLCRNKLDIRELAIQFGCIRLIPFVQKGLSL